VMGKFFLEAVPEWERRFTKGRGGVLCSVISSESDSGLQAAHEGGIGRER
jgi:hypothetical protein